ncbi:COP9 signalosome (CSN) subunit [Ceratocystis pirilliformis]|uniref:COP9 signalosome (CSN) subunit n=1 Tax=Ceratocystis pirilliformis TaxID=259994 RepID=A0ABR3YYQ2_9PEZI
METAIREFSQSYAQNNGFRLAESFSPFSNTEDHNNLRRIFNSTSSSFVKRDVKNALVKYKGLTKLSTDELNGWVEVFCAYWKAAGHIVATDDGIASDRTSSWKSAYDAWREVTSQLIRGYTNHSFEHWTFPCLYTTGKYLRIFAIRADSERSSQAASSDAIQLGDDFDPELETNQTLRDCEQQLKRIFTLCLSDRAPIEESRKWALYYIVNLLFKTYFKLNSASLSRTILKALSAYQGDMPPLSSFPAAQRVTFKYYEGVLSFLEENYLDAEKHLTEAWLECHVDAMNNKEQILTYLIPCHLLTTHTLPGEALLAPFPTLKRLFQPLSQCIKRGNLAGFDAALAQGEDEFIRRRIYLTLERGRDIVLRNLLRKVFLANGFEEPKTAGDAPVRRTRVPVAQFTAAVSLASGRSVETDEVECLLANMIYKNLMKGYIAREHGIVVLSKTGAFPGTGV